MTNILQNFAKVSQELQFIKTKPTIIAVSKTFSFEHIKPLVEHGHRIFGENKVQEAKNKWGDLRSKITNLELHLIGNLQSNKAKEAVSLFDFIHSVGSKKLAHELFKSELKLNLKRKYFIQVNIGEEKQKTGISIEEVSDLVNFCKKEKNLDVVGLMCIPPVNDDPDIYFKKISQLNKDLGFSLLSMGMSRDYVLAAEFGATHLRIGSKIFGTRKYP